MLTTPGERSRSVEDDLVRFQLQKKEETDLGRMETWWKSEWGASLRLATVMALNKEGGSLRIIHDGTHGVHGNPTIKVEDHMRSPGIAGKRRILSHTKGRHSVRFGLKGDVQSAHRLVLVDRKDWGSQFSMAGDMLLVNQVGTQGIAVIVAMCFCRRLRLDSRRTLHS
jgi:hypothetical protein